MNQAENFNLMTRCRSGGETKKPLAGLDKGTNGQRKESSES